MEQNPPEIITISQLLQQSLPLTGASSLNFTPPNLNIKPLHQNPNYNYSDNNPPNPKTLHPLNHPTILIGTPNLPNSPIKFSTNRVSSVCPKTSCFAFADGSASVCCDFLDFHPRILGKKIRVLAWNFIPFNKCGNGFLEIIKWGFVDDDAALICSSSFSESFRLVPSDKEEKCNASYFIYGVLESVSPVTLVPCSTGFESDSGKSLLCGFLCRVLVCECRLCGCRDEVKALHGVCEGQGGHDFMKCVVVYFCGVASRWHPVMCKLVGSFVAVSRLRKRLVFVGKEESLLMYVTTDKTLLRVPELHYQCIAFKKIDIVGKGECGMYSGVVTGIYMQGMVVELDENVLLLVTELLLSLTHSLRIGAIVSVRNVHFVNPKFSWTKILILGACFKTSVQVKSFSPVETGCHIRLQSQSLLGNFIDSLPYSARLWALLVVSSLKKKFSGILSEKDILGSKNTLGLAQAYCSSCVPLSVFWSRRGMFSEYCNHDSCDCGSEPNYGRLKIVVPISSFISYCESSWMKMILEEKSDLDIMSDSSPLKSEQKSYNQPIKRFLQSKDTDFVLLGNLQSSQSSGRLQLVDATGSVDIVIPDFPTTWSINSVYQICDFTVVIEGTSDQADRLEELSSEAFSCRRLFNNTPLVKEKNLEIFLYCQFNDENSTNSSFCPDLHWKGLEELNGRFHMLRITHKYPARQKPQVDQVTSKRSSIFAEALILPLDVFLSEKDGNYIKILEDHQKDTTDHCAESYDERVKRCKTINAITMSTRSSGSSDAENELCGRSTYCSTTYKKTCGKNVYPSSSCAPEIQCFAAFKSAKCHCSSSSEISSCSRKANAKVRPCSIPARKIWLEFELDSFCKFQLMRIGGYYIIQHHEDDIYCTTEHPNYVSGNKIVVTSGTYLFSFSFSPAELLQEIPPDVAPSMRGSVFRFKEVLPEESHHIELPFLSFMDTYAQFCTDVHLFLPVDVVSLFEANLNLLEQDFVKPSTSFEELTNACQCMTESIKSFEPSNSCFVLPNGNLISLHGHVVALHDSENCALATHIGNTTSGDGQLLNILKKLKQSVCIHVLVDHHMVRIFGSLNKHAIPIGLGVNVRATFHRVLVLGEKNELMLTPASFIEINSVMLVHDQYEGRREALSDALGLHNFATMKTGHMCLISEMMQCLDHMLLQLHCKVVAVYVLVLEKNKEVLHPQARVCSGSSLVKIPLAGFVVDDGSASCCCWANNERAATLLKLFEVDLFQAPGKTLRRSTHAWLNNERCSKVDRVDRILQRCGTVVVKNYGSTFDSMSQDFAVSVGADKTVSSSDEKFLKFSILNACYNTNFWTVAGSLMDSSASERLEKCLMELDMPMLQLQNVWVRDVFQQNPITEAKSIIKELLNMKPVS